MTRFNIQGAFAPYSAPRSPRSNRYLRIVNKLIEQGRLSPKTPDDVICDCPACGNLCFGWQWHQHKTCFEKEGVQ